MNMYTIKDHPNLSFKLINRVTGWVAFVIASLTYILTAEPTASLWDCGEFITTSVGLQVGHPPGAPLFMIISRLFAIFAPSADTQALMINYMSGLCSGFTILFLFWSITHLARKIVVKDGEEMTLGQMFAILGASLIGSLTYAFTDTFWFSAVEGEVYAMSSLFTAIVFWAILKWENVAFEPYANRWLVFIAYLVGLSIGVHLLNLLAIPAIVFVYYFKKYKPTPRGIVKTGLLSLVILGFVNFMLIPGVIKIAGWFELVFVNGMGLPFNTGVVVYVLLIIGALTWGIRYTLKKGMPIWNTILTCFMVILIGYSSYSMVVIRSLSDPPIDENSPDNVFSLLSYINREQYGDSPLLYGAYYNAPVVAYEDGEPIYYQNKETGVYDVIGHKQKLEYDKRFCGIFPRMHSSSRPYYPQQYQAWGGKNNGPTYTVNGESITRPSFGNNLQYFFNYQLGHMYWRYFMWNFSGRQNDIQGNGEITHGNWITGIKFLDEIRLGNQDELPDTLKSEKGYNKYYMLPFILGLLGMFYQYRKGRTGKQDFSIVMMLFILTGIAIIVYLNQPPMEPRERDYAYAGSFYAFSIWIGLGVLSIWEFLNSKLKKANTAQTAVAVTIVCLFAVPVNMAAQNWDDHSRAGRYATVAHAKNYLNSCAPNAILFTYGDNDTFPLWYAQEVEGYRRDVRIVNLSLLLGSWYIDQLKRQAYETPAVPISFKRNQYREGIRDQVAIVEHYKQATLKEVMEFVASDLPQTKLTGYSEPIDYIPTRRLIIPVDSAKVVANGIVKPENANKILKELPLDLKGNFLNKSQLMVLDIIANANWERPIYFGVGMGTEAYLGLEKYFQLEGAAYRLVPLETKDAGFMDYGRIDSDILYDNLMNKFEWGNIKDPKVNIDYFHDNTIAVMKYRNTFLRLAEQLHAEGKPEKAIAVLDKCMEELPITQVPVDNTLLNYIPLYYTLGATEKANHLLLELAENNYQMLRYTNSLSPKFANTAGIQQEENISMRVIQMLFEIAMGAGQKELAHKIKNKVESIYNPALLRTAQPQSAAVPADSGR
ncbi:MAG: DUF2723 domain-containing protein [Odoribacter sp.]|nr:DUF2723 domain-containing protein [Odoribacter sp.]